MRVGNAPVSFGVYSKDGDNPRYEEVLDAIARAGYEGIELGPYGYLPIDRDQLSRVLSAKQLRLASSFVALPLEDASKRNASVEQALTVARLLATQGVEELILADDDDEMRARIAGRVPVNGSVSWSDGHWHEAARTLHAISRVLRAELGMRVVVHHHVGTFIETEDEIDRLMYVTDPELVGLLLDTGHAVYGGTDPLDIVAKHRSRIAYVHLKDVNHRVLSQVRNNALDVREATAAGVFCPLGEGIVDVPKILERLKSGGYRGWLIVEHDIIPALGGPDPVDSAKKSRELLTRVGV